MPQKEARIVQFLKRNPAKARERPMRPGAQEACGAVVDGVRYRNL